MRKAILIALSILVFDQATKFFMKALLETGESLFNLGIFSFTLTFNTGAGFSILQGNNYLLAVLNILIIGFVIYYFRKAPKREHTALALVLGGAFGNLIDRLLFGMVTDFISVWKWPVFNIADSAVCIGVFLLLTGDIMDKNKKK